MILDVDGNGWSDRFRLISHFNTPILKQASNLTGKEVIMRGPADASQMIKNDQMIK
jgi:hypothetical protein